MHSNLRPAGRCVIRQCLRKVSRCVVRTIIRERRKHPAAPRPWNPWPFINKLVDLYIKLKERPRPIYNARSFAAWSRRVSRLSSLATCLEHRLS